MTIGTEPSGLRDARILGRKELRSSQKISEMIAETRVERRLSDFYGHDWCKMCASLLYEGECGEGSKSGEGGVGVG